MIESTFERCSVPSKEFEIQWCEIKLGGYTGSGAETGLCTKGDDPRTPEFESRKTMFETSVHWDSAGTTLVPAKLFPEGFGHLKTVG
jgi:hypothetical protein